jgi:single-strand DNA-binding protein
MKKMFAKIAIVTVLKANCLKHHKIIWRITMNSLNSILVEGNLVRDPDFRETPNGTPLCTFSIASNRYFRKEEQMEKEVSFFDVQTWAKLAENCGNLGRKGRGVRVVGRLKQDRWNDNAGNSRSKIYIVAEHVEFRPEMKQAGQAEEVSEEKFAACF